MGFQQLFDQYSWDDIKQKIYTKTSADVEYALRSTGKKTLDHFMALISTASPSVVSEHLSARNIDKTFGRTLPLAK